MNRKTLWSSFLLSVKWATALLLLFRVLEWMLSYPSVLQWTCLYRINYHYCYFTYTSCCSYTNLFSLFILMTYTCIYLIKCFFLSSLDQQKLKRTMGTSEVLKKFIIASLAMWGMPLTILYVFNNYTKPGILLRWKSYHILLRVAMCYW